MKDSLRVRPAWEADAEGIAQIYNHYIAHSTATFEESPVTARDIAGRMASVRAAGYDWLVAVGDEREDEAASLQGYAYSAPWNGRSAYRFSSEVTAYIAIDSLGKGVGTQLYQALFAQLRARGQHTVMAGIALPNVASVALHEKFGMHQVAHYQQVGFKFEQWIDVGYWQLLLDDEGES